MISEIDFWVERNMERMPPYHDLCCHHVCHIVKWQEGELKTDRCSTEVCEP